MEPSCGGAPDGGDSPRFLGFFLSLGSFPFPGLFLPSRRKRKPLAVDKQSEI